MTLNSSNKQNAKQVAKSSEPSALYSDESLLWVDEPAEKTSLVDILGKNFFSSADREQEYESLLTDQEIQTIIDDSFRRVGLI
jgi:hypothetical protein